MPVQLVQLLGSPIQLQFTGGVTPEGAYAGGTTYTTGDSVSYNGSSYVAIQETTGNLPTNTTYWQVLASKGDTGAKGDTGDTGAKGADGLGVPAGGTTGQSLVKKSNADNDTEWKTLPTEGLVIAYSVAL